MLGEPKAKLVLLLDDIEALVKIPRLLQSVLSYANDNFGALVLTAERGFNLTELMESSVTTLISDAITFEILPFGHKLRYQLVKRWCLCNGELEIDAFEKSLHNIEQTVNAIVGRNLAPSFPLFLLVVLQGMESAAPAALQSSSYAYYYQYLITKGLSEAGIKQDQHDEVMNYLTHLAWFYRERGGTPIEEVELQGFNEVFGRRFHKVALGKRIEVLRSAAILAVKSGRFEFAYPYLYHFFLGRYLAIRYPDAEVKNLISRMCENLRDRDNANSILFLTHHRKDSEIIEGITTALRNCFADFKPITLDTDIDAINGLVDETSNRVLQHLDVEESKVERRQQLDRIEEERQTLEVNADRDLTPLGDFIRESQLVFRTVDMIGQILKNYYGSLERSEKQKLLREIFDGPMRLLASFLKLVGDDPMALVGDIEKRLKVMHPKAKDDQIKSLAKRITFDLLGAVTFSMILRPAQAFSIQELDDDVDDLKAVNPSTAYLLTQAASWLVRPAPTRTDAIKSFAAELKQGGAFGYRLLQSLGVMHLHMFNMRDAERQKLCNALGIELPDVRRDELSKRGLKKLPR